MTDLKDSWDCGDHDWEDVTCAEETRKHFVCTMCSVEKFEPFSNCTEIKEDE